MPSRAICRHTSRPSSTPRQSAVAVRAVRQVRKGRVKRHSSARHGLALSRCARRIGAQHATRRFRRQIAIRAQCAKTSKKTRAVADMQEQSQPPIPRGHCQSRHDKFPHARIAHSGPPITASAPREKNGAASSFQSPCKSVRNPFPNPARARRHRGKTGQTFGTTPHISAFPGKAQTFMPSIRKSRHLGF